MRLSSCVRVIKSILKRRVRVPQENMMIECQMAKGSAKRRMVEDGDTFSKMLPNLEISTPKEGDGDFDASGERCYPKMKKTRPIMNSRHPRMDWLSVTCMTTYMKYLYGSFMSSQERYTFANPSNFTNYGNDDGEKIQHLQIQIRLLLLELSLMPEEKNDGRTKLASGQGKSYTMSMQTMRECQEIVGRYTTWTWHVDTAQFLLSFVSLEEDCKKAQESYASERKIKKCFAAPHMASTPFTSWSPT
ncbi:hypothetical protein IFM89_002749 [Coptis chinensis]|uniref:Uncharacterized protein n=1 Tax=Coptis chinensis TaxID=261450 RepID=A0A835MCN2_9MAGN|nr:hypothetical protein IFM89_002749 [Coptis chinensis]